jgi:His-Xaa-Ser system radical SAM maturase HxsB
MLNHFNFKKIDNEYLLTNDAGKYAFVNEDCFQKLVGGTIDKSNEKYEILKDNFFLFDEHEESFVGTASVFVKNLKSYTFTATSLHIFAVTNGCNMNCIYCQAKDINTKEYGKMDNLTGEKAIELAMTSPAKHLTFEFQGGEPLLNFEVVKHMIEHSKKINKDKQLEYTIVSNLVLLDEEILDYLIENNVSICTSIDGNSIVQNNNRPLKSGSDSYQSIVLAVKMVRERGRMIGAIETTTRFGLQYYKELVDTYIALGISNIFIRPLSPLGLAKTHWDKIGYSPEEFLVFYEKALLYILELNKRGIHFIETHASYFLKKILAGYSDNYMELRSPCGATVGQMSYYYDGSVYTCDEGRMLSEMGDEAFKLGDVYSSTYDEMLNSPVCKSLCASSILESLPSCCDCVYHPFCGVCPIITYAEGSDIFPKMPRDYRCKIYAGILNILFKIICKGDSENMNVFYNWI